MASIYQVIDELTDPPLDDLLIDVRGYSREHICRLSTGAKRATVLSDYEFGLLSSRDIRELAEGA